MSVLLCFSKIHERQMKNCLFTSLKENNIIYEKQFGFQRGYSNNVIIQLFDKMFDFFEKEQFILGVFISLSKTFDTVDHSILLKKIKPYGIIEKSLTWFESYASSRNQYINIDESSKSDLIYVTFGVPKDIFLDHFCFQHILTTYQMHLAHSIQLNLPMIRTFSLVIRALSTSLHL